MSRSNSNAVDVIDAADLVATESRSGRAVWDDRGNTTWEWQTQPGVFSRDIDTVQLRALDASHSHLQIVEHPPLRHGSKRR